MRSIALLLAFCLSAACSVPVVSPPPSDIARVSVLPPLNRTGDELLLEPLPLLFWEDEPKPHLALPAYLAGEARAQLAAKGFEITPPEEVAAATGGQSISTSAEASARLAAAGLDAPALWMEISRFETDRSGSPTFVNAKLALTLIDPEDGTVLWQAHWPTRPVRVGGAWSNATAYQMAARSLLETLLADLRRSPDARSLTPGTHPRAERAADQREPGCGAPLGWAQWGEGRDPLGK